MKKILYFAAFLGITAALVTGIAYAGYEITNPVIEENQVQRIKDNIALLYSTEDGYIPNSELPENSYQEKNYKPITAVYEVLNSDGDLHAVIYNVSAQGRNGIVSALIAVNPYTDEVDAVTYYSHTETPNIGEKYTREDEISKLIGQKISGDVVIDVIAGASTTWVAIEEMFNTVETHYANEEVHVNE
jgi:Na+-transporting NADH:ubiquinone oxidoreductase subunit C